MPGPAVYVAAIVGTVAVAVAFKEFVYEPHLAPKLEQWAEDFVAKRRAQRQRRAMAMSASSQPFADRSNTDMSADDNRSSGHAPTERSVELEQLAAREMHEWGTGTSGLRRRNIGAMDESNLIISYPTMSPTHVVYDSSAPVSPISTTHSRRSTAVSLSESLSSLNQAACNDSIAISLSAASDGQRTFMAAPPTPRSLSSRTRHSSTGSRTSSPEDQLFHSALVMPAQSPSLSASRQSVSPTPPASHPSPFADPIVNAVAFSPFVEPAPVLSLSTAYEEPAVDFDFLSAGAGSDDDTLSLSSASFSVGGEEGDHEMHSDGESVSSWASVERRTSP